MQQFLQIVIAGVATGSIYAAVALGFTLIFSVSRAVNLAQGDFVTLGAAGAWWLVTVQGVNYILAAIGATLLVVVVALLFERIVITPAQGTSLGNKLVLSIGVSFLIQGVLFLWVGPDPQAIKPIWNRPPFEIFGARITTQQVLLIGTVLLIGILMAIFLRKLPMGFAMRATAQNPVAAGITGINVNGVRMLAYAISGAIGGLVGVLSGPIIFVQFNAGTALSLQAFVAAVVLGIGSPLVALIGGLLLGVMEQLSAGYVSSLYSDVPAFILLVVVVVGRSYLRNRDDEKSPPSPGGYLPVRPTASVRLPTILALGAVGVSFVASNYTLTVLTLVVIYGVALLGLDIMRGFTGMLSLGQGAFMAVGAYSVGYLSTEHGWSTLETLVVAVPLTVFLATAVALSAVRLSGYNLALVTLGLAVIVENVARGTASITGGSSGITSIPALSIGSWSANTPVRLWLVTVVVFILGFVVARNLTSSAWGRKLRSIKQDELAAASLGVKVDRAKIIVFNVAALYACLAGILLAHYLRFVSPDVVGLQISLVLLSMLVVGGEGSLWGVLLGAFVLRGVPELYTGVEEYELIINGVLLLAVLLLSRGGLSGLVVRTVSLFKRTPSRSDPPPVLAGKS